MLQPIYDKNAKENVNGEIIEYGLVHGNEKIVFIKTGADGNIRGYQDKYLKMAHRVHERLGATVICASNPDIEHGHEDADRAMIASVAAEAGFASYECEWWHFSINPEPYPNTYFDFPIKNQINLYKINLKTHSITQKICGFAKKAVLL